MEGLAAAAILGPLVTKLVDLVRNAVDADDALPKATWNVAAFALGVGVALAFGVDAVGGLLGRDATVAGQLLTGLAIGGWSSGFHELFDRLSPKISLSDVAAAKRLEMFETQDVASSSAADVTYDVPQQSGGGAV